MNQHPASWAWEQNVKGLSKLVLLGLLGLADYSGTKNKATFPSNETLAKKCGISRSTVIRAIKDLVKAGLVTKEKRPNSSNFYHLNLKYLSDTEEVHSDTSIVSEEHLGGITETPKPIKNQSVTNQLTKEREWGHDQAIEQTIGNGWRHIYDPNASSSKPRAEGAPETKVSSAKKSLWELKQQMEAIEIRMDELKKHRGEVAGGDHIWTNEEAKREFFELCKMHKAINAQRIPA